MILIPTGSFNATEMLLKVEKRYDTFVSYYEVWNMEKMCCRFKQPCLTGAFNTYSKRYKTWSFETFLQIAESMAEKINNLYNDEHYSIAFNNPPSTFIPILNFVKSGYSREDFSYIETMIGTYSTEIILRAIKEQDDNWNYVKLLFKKCVEVSSKVAEEKERAERVAGRVKTSNPLEEKDVNVFSAMDTLDEWEAHNREEDMWSIFD